jgi:predicted DNA-binding protein (UPF0251 family)
LETVEKITIKKAAEIMQTSQQFIREGLKSGKLPFGTAVNPHGKHIYYISPKLFYDYVGQPS